MEAEEISIRWDVCKVFDAITVIMCYKCCGYNHKAKECKKYARCPKCAGSHSVQDCKATDTEIKCLNSKYTINRLNLRIDTKHAAWDPKCHVLKQKLEMERNKVHFLE